MNFFVKFEEKFGKVNFRTSCNSVKICIFCKKKKKLLTLGDTMPKKTAPKMIDNDKDISSLTKIR